MLNSLNLTPAFPEIFLLAAACVILLADLAIPDSKRQQTFWLTLVALGGTALLCLLQLGSTRTTEYAMHGMFVADAVGYTLKLFACVAVAITLIFSRHYASDRELMRGEWMTLSLFMLLGQMVIISAGNLLTLYLGLELMSLSLYALVALRRDSVNATEAGMKYFILGALASGFLLYGMSMLYGASGTLDIAQLAQAATSPDANRLLYALGLVFVVAGIAFKLSAAPFHMWAPDVYDGAPTAITLLIAGSSKLAAFAMVLRLIIEGLPSQAADWQQMFVVLSCLSLLIGNVTAIAQSNLKRLLAYSAIGQIGFMMLGFASGYGTGDAISDPASAYAAAMFYTLVYVFTTLGTFGVILLLTRAGFECDKISDLAGLNKRAPWLAFVMLLLMFSLTGIPPTVGFYAKLAVLQAAVGSGHLALAIFAVLMSAIAAFYYLRVVKVMYFDEPAEGFGPVAGAHEARVLLGITGALVLILGVFGGSVLSWCYDSMRIALSS
ncbi:NADH-quinone oxidoreductase subunit NuoN [soil metagenome]